MIVKVDEDLDRAGRRGCDRRDAGSHVQGHKRLAGGGVNHSREIGDGRQHGVVVAAIAIANAIGADTQRLAGADIGIGVKFRSRCGVETLETGKSGRGDGTRIAVEYFGVGARRDGQRSLGDEAGRIGHGADRVVIAAVPVVDGVGADGKRFGAAGIFVTVDLSPARYRVSATQTGNRRQGRRRHCRIIHLRVGQGRDRERGLVI